MFSLVKKQQKVKLDSLTQDFKIMKKILKDCQLVSHYSNQSFLKMKWNFLIVAYVYLMRQVSGSGGVSVTSYP